MSRRRLGLAALGALAACYFLRTIFRSIEWLDEGMIIQASWRTARGELPYIDYPHGYGPALFFVNAALFRLFGENLHLIRLALLVLKTVVVIQTYALARTVAPRLEALVAVGVLIAVWGAPIWLFSVPYATYYATPLCLTGFLLLLRSRETPAHLFAAGIAFGTAATFKQTQGLFTCLSAVLLLVATAPPSRARGPGRELGVLAVLAVAGLAVAYLGDRLLTATALLAVGPTLACCAAVGWRAVRRNPDAAMLFGRLVALGAGMALPLIAWVAFYARVGGLHALAYDTVGGLLQKISWTYPFVVPPLRSACFGGVVLASFALVGARGPRTRGLAAGALAACAVVVAVEVARGPGFHAYVVQWSWPTEFLLLLPWLPFVLLAYAASGLARGFDRARGLAVFAGAAALLQLFPGADLPHVAMGLPGFVPILAWGLARTTTGGWRPGALALLILWPLAMTLPYVRPWLAPPPPPLEYPLERATGVAVGPPVLPDLAALVRELHAITRGRTVLVTSEERIFYFLADVPAALPRDEFAMYLVGAGLIADAQARTIVDEDAMIAALAAQRPVVIERTASTAAVRFRSAFPRVTEWLDRRYAPLRTVGAYQLRAPREAAPVDSGATPRVDAPRPEPGPR